MSLDITDPKTMTDRLRLSEQRASLEMFKYNLDEVIAELDRLTPGVDREADKKHARKAPIKKARR